MNEEIAVRIIDAMDKVLSTISSVGADLWAVAIKRAIVGGIMNILIALMALYCARWFYKYGVKDNEREAAGKGESFGPLWWFFALCSFITAVVLVYSGIIALVTPEWKALHLFLSLLETM